MTTIRYPAGHSSDDWGLIISSEVSSGAPAGDVNYFFANKVKVNNKSLDKSTILSKGKKRRLARGMKDIKVSAPSVWIPTRSMAELNTCNGYMHAWMQEGHAPVYLWIRTKYSGSWVWYDFPDVNGDMVDYLMGYIDAWDDDLDQIFLKSISFSNAYTGGS